MSNVEIFSTFQEQNEYLNTMIVLSLLQSGEREKDIVAVYRNTSAERAGLISIIKALKALKKPTSVTIYTDSKFIVDAVNKGMLKRWINNHRNKDLWKIIYNLIQQHKTEFVWAKPTMTEISELKRNALELSENCDLLIDRKYEESK